jgi:hypothetical protein
VPNPPCHTALAFRLADRLQQPFLARHPGPLLLGSTAPDIRAMTGAQRDDTHFAPLESTDLDAGVRGLFAAHPQLCPLRTLSEESQAFLVGYISHLVADQAWINGMYRPYFETADRFPNPVAAMVMDRALQLEMDRRAAADVERALPLLAQAEEGVDIGFIDGPTLLAWREWLEGRLSQGFTWERLRFMARRRQDPADVAVAESVADTFLESVPRGLSGLEDAVPWRLVEGFQAVALGESERLARRLIG